MEYHGLLRAMRSPLRASGRTTDRADATVHPARGVDARLTPQIPPPPLAEMRAQLIRTMGGLEAGMILPGEYRLGGDGHAEHRSVPASPSCRSSCPPRLGATHTQSAHPCHVSFSRHSPPPPFRPIWPAQSPPCWIKFRVADHAPGHPRDAGGAARVSKAPVGGRIPDGQVRRIGRVPAASGFKRQRQPQPALFS